MASGGREQREIYSPVATEQDLLIKGISGGLPKKKKYTTQVSAAHSANMTGGKTSM
jgi:hypothetical protein